MLIGSKSIRWLCPIHVRRYLFVCFPGLSLWEWHPFSISSAPHEDKILVHIRPLGNWTDALGKLAEASAGGDVSVVLEGPYGAPTFDIEGDRYHDFVMVSGGIGTAARHRCIFPRCFPLFDRVSSAAPNASAAAPMPRASVSA